MAGWNNPQNATAYETYAQTHPMYRKTSASLVKLATVSEGMQVLDLCCGTGITSEAVLAQLKGTGHLYAVDLAQAMLNVANAKLSPEHDNYSVHQSAAENLDNITDTPIQRIVCNSAFWQVDAKRTLATSHRVLAEDGVFVFNLPDTFYDIEIERDPQEQSNVPLFPIMRRIATQEYGATFKPRSQHKSWKLTYNSILEKLTDAGFTLQHYEIIGYEQSMAATFDFFKIPVMTERILPNVDYETRLAILKKATDEMPSDALSTRYWAYFVLQKQ